MTKGAKILIVAASLFTLVAVTNRAAITSYLLSTEQEQYIQELNAAAQNPFRNLIHQIELAGWNVIITSGYRSFSEQWALLQQGQTQTEPGYSMHNYGLAIDINIQKGLTWLRKSSSKSDWEQSGIPALAQSLGFTWGGNFSSYDPVHFALQLMNINDLYQLAVNQFGTNADDIQGNQIYIAA